MCWWVGLNVDVWQEDDELGVRRIVTVIIIIIIFFVRDFDRGDSIQSMSLMERTR